MVRLSYKQTRIKSVFEAVKDDIKNYIGSIEGIYAQETVNGVFINYEVKGACYNPKKMRELIKKWEQNGKKVNFESDVITRYRLFIRT